MITDIQRVEFLDKLVADSRRTHGVMLTEWENDFSASFIRFPNVKFFAPGGVPSQGRRDSVNRMWMRYGPEINWPHPMDRVSEAAPIAPADPAGCEYLVREEGRQRRCNDPATCREPGRLRYCALHGEAVAKDCKRAGIKFCLVNFQPQMDTDEHR